MICRARRIERVSSEVVSYRCVSSWRSALVSSHACGMTAHAWQADYGGVGVKSQSRWVQAVRLVLCGTAVLRCHTLEMPVDAIHSPPERPQQRSLSLLGPSLSSAVQPDFSRLNLVTDAVTCCCSAAF